MLLSNGPEAMFKQRNPCLNHEIHALFEYAFHLKILKTGCRFFTWCYVTFCCHQNRHFTYFCYRQRQSNFHGMTSLFMAYEQHKFYGFQGIFKAFSKTFFNGIISKYKKWSHVCFIALTFARSLGRCLTARPVASYSNSFLGTWQMLMHEKMCNPYIWASSWDYGTYYIGDQRRLRQACAFSPEPSLFTHMKYDGSRRRVRPKIRHLAPLDGWACAFEEWVYGGRKVP